MKIVIDGNDLVSENIAVQMALKVLNREDGVVKFTDRLAMKIKTAKTQRSFTVVSQNDLEED